MLDKIYTFRCCVRQAVADSYPPCRGRGEHWLAGRHGSAIACPFWHYCVNTQAVALRHYSIKWHRPIACCCEGCHTAIMDPIFATVAKAVGARDPSVGRTANGESTRTFARPLTHTAREPNGVAERQHRKAD